jgi:hypothetical protein
MTIFTHLVMNFLLVGCCRFFEACFFGMQLSQVDDFEPLQQDTETFYAVELSEIDGPSAAILRFIYPKKHAQIKPKLATQYAPLSLQRQHLVLIE